MNDFPLGNENENENENAIDYKPDTLYPYWTYNAPYFLVYSCCEVLFQTSEFHVLHETFPKIRAEYVEKNKKQV